MIVNYLKKEMVQVDMCTEPINFLPDKEFAQIMCQTEAMIEEPQLVDEPIVIE